MQNTIQDYSIGCYVLFLHPFRDINQPGYYYQRSKKGNYSAAHRQPTVSIIGRFAG